MHLAYLYVFTYGYVLFICSDDNECAGGYVCGLALCINTPGSYDCQCSGGLTFDLNQLSCVGQYIIHY